MLDPDKDALVNQIVKQQFGTDYNVVDASKYRGQVASVLKKNTNDNSYRHGDTYYVDHGQNVNNRRNDLSRLPGAIKGRAKVISIGETIHYDVDILEKHVILPNNFTFST